MLFQTFDIKQDCPAIYVNNSFIKETSENLSKSWNYHPSLKGKNIEYANLFVENCSLEEICPDLYKKDLENINKKLKAINNSFINSKISLNDNCFYDMVPIRFLEEYCDIKNKITEYVLNNYSKPKQYDFFRRFNELIFDIKDRNQNIDMDQFKAELVDETSINYYRKLLNVNKYIEYNLFGSITGRLSTTKDSFPIQNFPKKYRKYLKPVNDWFISFDINAAELRTSLALLDKEQTNEDFYEMLAREIFKNNLTRKEVKEATTAWLYNSSNSNASIYKNELEKIFEKDKLKSIYWDGKYIFTPFDRKIESDEHHAISYLNQSTFIDLFHRQVLKVYDFLKDKNTFISFLVHDQFVIDVKDDEKHLLIEIINLLQDTKYGKFPVKVEAGKNFGEMKKLKLKV